MINVLEWDREVRRMNEKSNIGGNMDLVAILAAIEALKAQVVALEQAQAEKLAQVAKEEYDKGFAAGVASVVPGVDKIYSQADLDQAVASAVALVQVELEAVKAEAQAVKVELEALKLGLPQQLAQAKAELKAELLAKYQAAQEAESQLEKALEEELKAE